MNNEKAVHAAREIALGIIRKTWDMSTIDGPYPEQKLEIDLITSALLSERAKGREEEREECAKVVCVNCHHGYSFSEQHPECHRVPYRNTYSLEPCKAQDIRSRSSSKGPEL